MRSKRRNIDGCSYSWRRRWRNEGCGEDAEDRMYRYIVPCNTWMARSSSGTQPLVSVLASCIEMYTVEVTDSQCIVIIGDLVVLTRCLLFKWSISFMMYLPETTDFHYTLCVEEIVIVLRLLFFFDAHRIAISSKVTKLICRRHSRRQ